MTGPSAARCHRPVSTSETSSAWTSPSGVSNEISADPFAASRVRRRVERDRDALPAPEHRDLDVATTRPLMSGDHGGTVPSVAAHAVSP